VQEAFLRTIASPPPDLSRPLRPWLVRVTMNVARDQLRRRRRRGYHGPWLPGVVDDETAQQPTTDLDGEARYSRKESVTFAFLIALEALTPLQRAVLVLRDVFDFSGRETAEALGISDDNAKQLLSRARKALADYDARSIDWRRSVAPQPAFSPRSIDLSPARSAASELALQKLLFALATDDSATVLSLLRDDVVGITDGGPYRAAKVAIVGAKKLAATLSALTKHWPLDTFSATTAIVNSQPAIVLRAHEPQPGYAPLWVLRVDLDDDGLIAAVHSLGAPDKCSSLLRLTAKQSGAL
ncbi:MAG TPA: sigma-70 family RNA polymerase sigma factor, partial [Myxococcota bacterium]